MSIRYHDQIVAGTPELATVVEANNGKPVTSGAVKSALPMRYSVTGGNSVTFAVNAGCLILVSRDSVAVGAIYTIDIAGAVSRIAGTATGHTISYSNGNVTVTNTTGIVATVSLFNAFT